MLETIRKNGVTLAIFAAITTAATAVVNTVTRPTVEHQTLLQQINLLETSVLKIKAKIPNLHPAMTR